MGVRIIAADNLECAVLYCSTSGWAFGPLFADYYEADSFLKWLEEKDGRDARRLTDQEMGLKVSEFRSSTIKCEYCGKEIPLVTHYTESHWCPEEEKHLLDEPSPTEVAYQLELGEAAHDQGGRRDNED